MIEQLTLTNFKAFQHVDIPLGSLTLLTGLNSSGKSSVLQALALLHQSYAAGDLDRAAQLPQGLKGGRSTSVHDNGFLLNGELAGLGIGRDVLHEDFVGDEPEITLAVSEGAYRYSWTVAYEAEQNLLPLVAAELPLTAESETDRPAGDAAVIPAYFEGGLQYLHADRICPVEFYPRDHHAAIARGFLGVRGEHTVNYLRHHARDTVPEGPLRHPRESGKLLRDHVAAWMGELCPGVNIQTDPIEGTDSVLLSYGFGEAVSTQRRRPANVGFGLTYALPIVVACLTARPGALVMLENPEAHLHPQGQTRMATLAAAAAAQGAQVLVETHSDHVLNGARLAVKEGELEPDQVVVHYFRGDGSGTEVVTPRLNRDGQLNQWPEGFFDELENSLDRLLI